MPEKKWDFLGVNLQNTQVADSILVNGGSQQRTLPASLPLTSTFFCLVQNTAHVCRYQPR